MACFSSFTVLTSFNPAFLRCPHRPATAVAIPIAHQGKQGRDPKPGGVRIGAESFGIFEQGFSWNTTRRNLDVTPMTGGA
jgi:hypothetical protein